MEVHAFSYTEWKKRTPYLWQFLILFPAMFCVFFSGNAQLSELVMDKETLFSKTELASIDSLLQAYHKRSGNLVAVYTDTANISNPDFGASVYTIFKKPGTDSAYSYILMMSHKHSLLFSSVNKKTMPFINDQLLVGILEKGFASFKEKRRAEGVMKICSGAMIFLDGLPKNNY